MGETLRFCLSIERSPQGARPLFEKRQDYPLLLKLDEVDCVQTAQWLGV